MIFCDCVFGAGFPGFAFFLGGMTFFGGTGGLFAIGMLLDVFFDVVADDLCEV